MKKNLKFLILSFIIALTFASPRVVHGMENFSGPVTSSSAITHKVRENPFRPEKCPLEIRFKILEHAVIDNNFSSANAGVLRLICKDWRRIVEQDRMKKSIESIIYQRFLKGVLIYRPQEGSDVGRINLPIAALGNPLEGTFDLSQCGVAGKYLSISTGYRKGKKSENAGKVEIWFAPRFLIRKELKTTASHFEGIMAEWNDSAPVGIFWTWGDWDALTDYDYLIAENLEALSSENLFEKYEKSACEKMYTPLERSPANYVARVFHIHFLTAT